MTQSPEQTLATFLYFIALGFSIGAWVAMAGNAMTHAQNERQSFEQRKALAAKWSKETPLILIHRMGRKVLARVVWAEHDKIRLRRWIGTDQCEYARPETVSFAMFAGMPATQDEPPIQTQGLLSA